MQICIRMLSSNRKSRNTSPINGRSTPHMQRFQSLLSTVDGQGPLRDVAAVSDSRAVPLPNDWHTSKKAKKAIKVLPMEQAKSGVTS